MKKPLTRWLDSDGPREAGLRTALLDARRGPSEAQVEALAKRIAERRAGSSSASRPRNVARGSRVVRWVASVGVGLSLVLGAVMWNLREASEQPRATPAEPLASAVSKRETSVPSAPEADDFGPPALSASDTPQPTAAASHTEATRTSKSPAAQTRVLARDEATQSLDEVVLLQKARRALLSRPATALALALKHHEVFPRGTFEEERKAIQIEALWRLERFHEAQRQWKSFEREYPYSTYRSRLERLQSPE